MQLFLCGAGISRKCKLREWQLLPIACNRRRSFDVEAGEILTASQAIEVVHDNERVLPQLEAGALKQG